MSNLNCCFKRGNIQYIYKKKTYSINSCPGFKEPRPKLYNQGPVVQTLNCTIHRKNLYPVDKY